MKEIQQLIKKNSQEGRYEDIFPKTFTDAITDKSLDTTLDIILNRNNFIAVPYLGNKTRTRLQIPMVSRRSGLWISYQTFNKSLVVEFFKGDYLDDAHWVEDIYWFPYNTAEYQPHSVSLDALAQDVFDYISQSISNGNDDLYDKIALEQTALLPEDLSRINKKIQIADREYKPTEYSGLGYVLLRRNMIEGKSILTQDMINLPNTVYEVRYDFDLNGNTITIPDNCVLKFEGGSLNSGTINFNNTVLVDLINFNNIITVGNIINNEVKIEWFGGGITKNDTINDIAFKAAIRLAYNSKISTIMLSSGTYNISEPIVLLERMTLRGDTRLNTILQKTSNTTYKDIDCVIYLDKSENYSLNYTEYISITNLRIVNITNTPIEHAIYGNIAPYTKIENIGITGTNIGITIRASWLSEISRVNANVLKRGINIDSTTSNTTTLKLSNIYVLGTSEYGYYLKSVTYSEMENLALDQATNGIGYHLEYFTGSINGIGCESTKLRTVVECVRAVVTMTGVNFWGQKDINTPTTNDSMFKLSAICNITIESGNFSNGTGSIVDIPTKFLIMYNNCRLTLRNIRNNLNFTVKSTIDGNGTNVTIDDHEKTFQTQNAIAYIGANNKAVQSLEGSNYNIGDGIDCNNAIILNSSRLPTVRNSNGTNVEYFHPLENGTLILNNKPNEDGSIGSVITSNLDEEVTFLGTVSEINGNYFKMTSYVPESNNKSTYIQIRTVLQVGSVISSVVEIIGSGIRLYSGTEGISVGNKVSIPIPSKLGQETYSKIPLILPVLPGNEPTQATAATPIFSIINDIPLWRNASASGWVDSKGNLSQKYTGIFNERPNSAYLKKGFKYYCTDLECFIIFNGDTWINEDGTLCSKVLYTSDITSFTRNNFTYKITTDIDLQGVTLTMPANCTLDFQGGSFSNGTIILNNTKVLPLGCNIEDYITATIDGSYKEGQILYDSVLKKMKLWNGTAWVNLDGTALA